MTFSTINATLCTGSAARAQHTQSSINVHQKVCILHQRRFGGLFLQLPHSRVRAATGANKITLGMYAKSGVDVTSRIVHQADVQVWALRSSLCLRTVSWLVARISWEYFGLTCLCQNYLLDASEWGLRLCAASFRTYFWDAGPVAAMACMSVCAEQFLLSSRKVGPYSTGMTNHKSSYCQALNGRRQIGICLNVFNEVEFTNQWQPSLQQPSHPNDPNVQNGVQVSRRSL